MGTELIYTLSRRLVQISLGVEFLTEDSGEYLHEYAYNKGSVKIAWGMIMMKLFLLLAQEMQR